MTIVLNLHPIVAEQTGDPHSINVPEGATVDDALAVLGIDATRAGFVLVNGQQIPYDTPLHDGDSLFIMPFLGGG